MNSIAHMLSMTTRLEGLILPKWFYMDGPWIGEVAAFNYSHVHTVIQQTFVQLLLHARPCDSQWGHKNKTPIPSLEEFTVVFTPGSIFKMKF